MRAVDRYLDLETNRNGSRLEGERTLRLLPGGLATNRLGQSVTAARDLAARYQGLIPDTGGWDSVELHSPWPGRRSHQSVHPVRQL